jgi:phosphoribosyl-AMP cyclohydrolase
MRSPPTGSRAGRGSISSAMDQPDALPLDPEVVDALAWSRDGLIPAVVVDEAGTVLMVAWMDREALARTARDGTTWFYSRSRQEHWHKGDTSGARQEVREIVTDCDSDTLLVRVRQRGTGACHTGSYSCFTRQVTRG